MTFDLADRGIYGFATTENLRFADVDANGHVNNGSFIELLESARVSYLRIVVRPTGVKGGLPPFRLVIGRIEAEAKENERLRWLLGGIYFGPGEPFQDRISAIADAKSWQADDAARRRPKQPLDGRAMSVEGLARPGSSNIRNRIATATTTSSP